MPRHSPVYCFRKILKHYWSGCYISPQSYSSRHQRCHFRGFKIVTLIVGDTDYRYEINSYFLERIVPLTYKLPKGVNFDNQIGGIQIFQNFGWNRPKIAIFCYFLAFLAIFEVIPWLNVVIEMWHWCKGLPSLWTLIIRSGESKIFKILAEIGLK